MPAGDMERKFDVVINNNIGLKNYLQKIIVGVMSRLLLDDWIPKISLATFEPYKGSQDHSDGW